MTLFWSFMALMLILLALLNYWSSPRVPSIAVPWSVSGTGEKYASDAQHDELKQKALERKGSPHL
jgi:hypothetical protein